MRIGFAVAGLAVVACSSPDGICSLGFTPMAIETVISSPSLECYREGPSRTDGMGNVIPGPYIATGSCPSSTCLRVPETNPSPPKGSVYPYGGYGLSTTECESDSDCSPEYPCVSGFTCGVPPDLTVGPFCCQKFCVCKDYVVVPSTGVLPTPAACDPTISSNTCCNLAGRSGSSMYPSCAL